MVHGKMQAHPTGHSIFPCGAGDHRVRMDGTELARNLRNGFDQSQKRINIFPNHKAFLFFGFHNLFHLHLQLLQRPHAPKFSPKQTQIPIKHANISIHNRNVHHPMSVRPGHLPPLHQLPKLKPEIVYANLRDGLQFDQNLIIYLPHRRFGPLSKDRKQNQKIIQKHVRKSRSR